MKQKVWISKYALSGGIKEHEAEVRNGSAYPGAPFMSFTGFVLGKDAHFTKAEAVANPRDLALRHTLKRSREMGRF